ncbi:MAG: TetR/AcrR family transcriptional regulator [Myxococcales bacterium]|nr:TetR/AcrR family transcriptional regulator [Myxococcales bacterium]
MVTKRLPAEERKKQIVKSATAVFARKGYHGATTKRISQEAGVAEALIYRYFGSKKGLFSDAVRRTAERLVHGLEAALTLHPDDPSLAMQEVYTFYLDLLLKQRDLAKMIFLVFAELDDPEVRDVYLPHQEHALDVLSTAIRRWKKTGALRSDMPSRASAWLILGAFQVLALMKHSGRIDEIDPKAALELALPFLSS